MVVLVTCPAFLAAAVVREAVEDWLDLKLGWLDLGVSLLERVDRTDEGGLNTLSVSLSALRGVPFTDFVVAADLGVDRVTRGEGLEVLSGELVN